MFIYDGTNDRIIPETHRTVEVISTNKLTPSDHMTLRKNGRGDYALFFVISGQMTFDNVIVAKNQVWIYPPNVRQEYFTYKKDNVAYYYIHFTGNKIDQLISELNIPLMTPLNYPLDAGIFEKIKKAMEYSDALSKVKSECLTLELLSHLAKIRPVTTKENMMKKVLDEMHHSYFLPYDAKKFADIFSLSISRFNHLFKDATGMPPQRYYNKVRMENAATLLTETRLSITDIAQKTGFTDAFYFGQTFKKHYGVSPREWRGNSGK